LQIKPRAWEEDDGSGIKKCKEVQLVLKWGGNLTKLGENQAIRLGERLRQGLYPDAPGGGILRLHSTFRHDLKIKTSDEGRVMKTAAAFAKGLLELEGEIPPILVSLVHKEKGSMHMLDPSGDKEVKLELDECKERITANLQRDIDWRETTEEDRTKMVGPNELHSMRDALAEIGNPRKGLMEIYKTMGHLIEQLEEMLDMMGSGDEKRIEGGEGLKGNDEDDVALSGVKLYKGETLLELTERWKFIYKRLYDPDEDVFDLSRVPDVHDNVRFDVLHNPHLGLTSTLEKLYELAKSMADCVVPQEYGTTIAEKRSVGVKICSPLLEKLRYDLNIARTDSKADMRYMINMDYSADLPINTMGRRIRTRLYFTSESHLHTMLNCLRFAGAEGSKPLLSREGMEVINNTRELCYLTQIVMRLFEDTSRPMDDPRRFRVEILFAAGATATPIHIHEANRNDDFSRLDTAPLEAVGREDLTCKDVEDFFSSAIMEGGHKNEDDVASAPTAEKKKSPAASSEKAQTEEEKEKKRICRTLMQRTSAVLEEDGEDETPTTNSAAPSGDSVENLGGPNSTAGSLGSKESMDVSSSIPEDDESPKSGASQGIESKYFWSAVAAGTLLLGAGCLVMALSLGGEPRGYRRRSTIIRT
jgi:inositol hexakisphosphate/diphosphoinositol-pentakisphosphate kinase